MIALIVISAGIAYFLSLPFASLLQGSNYRLEVYFRRGGKMISICACFFLIFAAITMLVHFLCRGLFHGAFLSLVYVSSGVFTYAMHKKMGLRLTITNRLARLLIASIFLYSILFFPLYFLSANHLWAALPMLAPFVLSVAALLLSPFESINNERYLKAAKNKLDQTKALKIAITGSYGKTSVKNDLEQLLSERYETLATPANYNTPLGIAKTVEASNGHEEIMILEMGARRKGDIRELCALVGPTIGVITGIAPQHLETFGSIESILEEKDELARSIPPENAVYYNLSDDRVRVLYDRREGRKVGVGFEEADRVISDMVITPNGTSFSLTLGDECLALSAPIYGKAAVINLALACVIAFDLGVPADVLCEKIGKIAPTSHRFEVTKSGGVTVIDDSYNINPIGAASALSSLETFSAKRRIVYVSGIVELGTATERENRALGERIAATCDMAIVSAGKYGDYVVQGILWAQPSFAVVRVKDTVEATATFRQLLREGDLLLIMSDLPRDYLV